MAENETGAAGQAVALMTRGRERVMAMPPKRRTMLAATVLMLVALCAGVAWWEGRTDWKVLYSGLEGRDLQQVEQELAAGSIPYETTTDGAGVQVPAEMLDKARMEIATKGTPQSGRMGFELFDKPNWVGSEFDEKVNYQRAMEGELEHTIATLGAVRSARVHLVLPKDSLFTAEKQTAKASVVLKLKRSSMPAEQVESIRNLVAGAVENLAPDQVTLVDADGRVNLSAPGRNSVAGNGDAEHELEQKLVAMLEPLAGRENVRATVNIDYDLSTQERTDEVVDPAQVVPLSMQKHDEISGAPARASGVPGTASNTPAAAAPGSVAATLPVYPTGSAQSQTSHEESSTYAVSRHTTHEEVGPGRVRRVTAAVLVNDRELHDGEGKTERVSWKPRSADEMKRLEELARAAVGFDEKRGDAVVMQNVSFTANAPEPKVANVQRALDEAHTILRAQPGMMKMLMGSALAALLIFTVVRPVTRQAMAILSEPAVLPAGGRAVFGLPEGQDSREQHDTFDETATVNRSLPSRENDLPRADRMRRSPGSAIDEEGVRQYVTEHVRREPAHSTRLLEAWIGAKEEA